MYMVFSRQSLIGTCQILEGCTGIPKKEKKKNDRKNVWALLLSLLLHAPTSLHRQIGYGNDLGRGLCAWQFKNMARFARIMAANES